MSLRCDIPVDRDETPCGRPAVEVVVLGGGAVEIPRCEAHAEAAREPLRRIGAVREVRARGGCRGGG